MLRVLHLHICKYGDRKQLTRGRRNSNSVADSTPSRLRGAPAFRNIPRPICSANHSFRAKALGNDLGAAAQGLPLYPRPSSATRSATRSCFHYHHRWCEKTLVNPEHVSDCALCHGDPFWPGPGVSWCCCCPALGCHLSYVYWRSPRAVKKEGTRRAISGWPGTPPCVRRASARSKDARGPPRKTANGRDSGRTRAPSGNSAGSAGSAGFFVVRRRRHGNGKEHVTAVDRPAAQRLADQATERPGRTCVRSRVTAQRLSAIRRHHPRVTACLRNTAASGIVYFFNLWGFAGAPETTPPAVWGQQLWRRTPYSEHASSNVAVLVRRLVFAMLKDKRNPRVFRNERRVKNGVAFTPSPTSRANKLT